MKRYAIFVHHEKEGCLGYELEESDNGEVVKAEMAEELYEIVSELSCYKDSIVPHTLIELAGKVAKKARGEVE